MNILSIIVLIMSMTALAKNQCPMVYQKHGFNKDISSLEKNHVIQKDWWKSLDRIFIKHIQKYPSCDDGFMAEGFDDIIPRLIARDWGHSNFLFDRMLKNSHLSGFVIKHISIVSGTEDLNLLEKRAKNECTSKYRTICKKILQKIAYAGHD